MINRFFQEEEGQTLVEYGLIISLIALAVVAATALLGSKLRQFYGDAGNKYPTPVTS
jgi:pilus assembly protein Flp/PilA